MTRRARRFFDAFLWPQKKTISLFSEPCLPFTRPLSTRREHPFSWKGTHRNSTWEKAILLGTMHAQPPSTPGHTPDCNSNPATRQAPSPNHKRASCLLVRFIFLRRAAAAAVRELLFVRNSRQTHPCFFFSFAVRTTSHIVRCPPDARPTGNSSHPMTSPALPRKPRPTFHPQNVRHGRHGRQCLHRRQQPRVFILSPAPHNSNDNLKTK